MNQNEQINSFANEIDRVIDYHEKEFDKICYASAIGVLIIAAYKLLKKLVP